MLMTITNQFYFFFLVFLVVHTFASIMFNSCGHDQRDAFLEFKHEFLVNESNSSSLLSSWNKSNDYCSWAGVRCYAKSGNVVSLDLSFTLLNNSLKENSGLFKLQHLCNLTFKGCNLNEKISSSLGNFSHLKNLDLFANNLVGELPVLMENLSHLKYLDLRENDLVGEVLASIRKLTKLEYINLNQNKFSGYVPISFANFFKLSTFDIADNQFTDEFPFLLLNLTISLSDFTLEEVNVGGNTFSGTFPTSLFMIPSLTSVDLGINEFKGSIDFRNISSSSKHDYLKLHENKFDGHIPNSISNFSNLDILDLSHNNFSGPIPRSFNLFLTETLYLSNNNLEGEIPSWFGSVMTLLVSHNSFSSFGKLDVPDLDGDIQVLDFSSNSFQGPLPHWLCKLNLSTRLNIDLSNNNFSGSIPHCLRNTITGLRGLNLQNNNLSGILPDVFVNATELVSVDVNNNQLEGKLPKSLINFISLLLLNVQNNKIKDKFPSWMSSLPSLNVLILGSNDFYGPLYHPHVSNGFQSLKIIDISHNHFNGTLPPFYFANWSEMATLEYEGDYMEYGYLYRISMKVVNKGVDTFFELIQKQKQKDFKAINFSGNKFRGKIPKSIGLLKGLHLLNLPGNVFTSNIPQSLANLSNLEALDLSQNHVSGQIPGNFGSLSFLSVINFSHNNLQGPIPRGTQFQRQNCSAFMDNPKLSGLEDICGKTHVPSPTPQEYEDLSEPKEQVISWIAAVIAYGPGVLCRLVIGNIFSPLIVDHVNAMSKQTQKESPDEHHLLF